MPFEGRAVMSQSLPGFQRWRWIPLRSSLFLEAIHLTCGDVLGKRAAQRGYGFVSLPMQKFRFESTGSQARKPIVASNTLSASMGGQRGARCVGLVDLVRFELTTSSMPWKRAPNCATGPYARTFSD